MNNVYFGNEGMTSTTANHYAIFAKEMIKRTEEKIVWREVLPNFNICYREC